MTPACEQLHPFADGELPPAEADAFREHLIGCADCQRELDDVINLDALGAELRKAPLAAVKSLAEAREKKRRIWPVIAGAIAAAAAVLLVVRTPQTDVYGLGASRPLELRLTHEGASEFRPYDVLRGGSSSNAEVPLSALAKLEQKGDLHGLGEGLLLRGEKKQAETALARAGDSADVRSDRAAVKLAEGAPDEAVLILDQVLQANPHHPQALWNQALALRELGLPHASAEAFAAAAELREKGWSAEADEDARALRGMAQSSEQRWNDAHKAAAAMVNTAQTPSLDLVERDPGLFRSQLYDAVRAAPDAARVRALLPVAAKLDKIFGGDVVRTHLERVAASDFTRRAALAADYLKLFNGAPAAEALLKPDAPADIRMGALWYTHTIGQHLADYKKLADAAGDPWFHSVYARELAQSLAKSRPLEALEVLQAALRDAQAAHLDYRAIFLLLQLSDLELELHRVPEAWAHALAAHRIARAGDIWELAQGPLNALANAARFRESFALARAYLREALLRTPGDCRTQAFADEALADLELFAMNFGAARGDFDRIPECGVPLSLHGALVLADLARVQPRDGDLARLHEALDQQRPRLSPGELALADHIEGRALIERDRSAGRALLRKAIAAADALPRSDENAQKARGYSFSTLALDAGRAAEPAEVLAALAEEVRAQTPSRCAVGVALNDERAVLAVRGADGKDSQLFEGARREPMSRYTPRLTSAQLESLRPCARVDVFARPPLHGRADLLPPELAWSYRSGHLLAPSHAAPRELVIADVEAPAALELPHLAPWATSPQAGRTELRGAAATPARALAEMSEATEIEIHAHGLVDLSQADASMLVLSPDAGGAFALTAGAVRATKLKGAPLVLLAACRAAAPGTAMHTPWSLPAAFLDAGARAVLASTADIPDAQAREFFDAVRAGIRNGKEPAASLRDERVAFRARGASWVDSVLLFD